MSSNILIFGGNGFIGTNLSRCLLEKGFSVYSFDIKKPIHPIEGVKYIEGNFFNDEDMYNALRDKDMIVHAVCTINPGNSNSLYMNGYSNDFVQSIKVFEHAITNKQRLLFLSSGGTVYGEHNKLPINEDALPCPINHYGSLKLCLENVIKTFNNQSSWKLRIARISNPYGPGQDYNKGVGFIDAAVKKAINYEKLEIWGNGEIVRDYIYIDDVCNCLLDILLYDGDFDIFNVSSSVGNSQKDIVKLIRSFGYKLDVSYKDKRTIDVNKIILDNDRLLKISDVKITKIEDGLLKYCNYLSNKSN